MLGQPKWPRVTVGGGGGGDIFDRFCNHFGGHAQPKTTQSVVKRASDREKQCLAVHVGHSEGQKVPKVRCGTGKWYLQNHTSVCLVRGMGSFHFGQWDANRGPKQGQFGATNTNYR